MLSYETQIISFHLYVIDFWSPGASTALVQETNIRE